ncbi:LacI family DNA-binding transcriptional regulator [Actinophytocola sp.]|uniref:LacI family DNA-binding transcriptional regulator n=1 Tax=Actinophytocola sp. TaxID=1872138 RepID=UPI002D7E67DC|nr:LacI family DNA-binding transcriptional regulator [Actinophytocola sp.]HET9140276.1 LacI family DNA-binding transcriptional regulator [Actinophytocola sp.]
MTFTRSSPLNRVANAHPSPYPGPSRRVVHRRRLAPAGIWFDSQARRLSLTNGFRARGGAVRDRGRPTIHDVARAAGVSHQTVSNVLNGTGRVGMATRARVDAAIAELGYHPHAGAASLRTRRSGRLAYPIGAGDLGPLNTIMLEFVEALTSAAGRHHHHLVLAAGGPAGMDDVQRLLRSGAADAVVLANVAPRDERVAALAQRGVPFACFGRTEADLPQCWIDVDSRAGLREVTEYLVGLGHERVAFLGYTPQGRWDLDREAGYRDAMTAAGLAARVRTAEPDPPRVRQVIEALLESPPTAIVTGSDVLAGAVYAAAAQRGLRIGSDLAVTGFDGSMVGRLLTPALTTLAMPVGYIADRLVTRVLAEIDGPTGAPGELVRAELVLGASG